MPFYLLYVSAYPESIQNKNNTHRQQLSLEMLKIWSQGISGKFF
jgi:hypothetical protein